MLGLLQGITVAAVFLLVLIAGVCVAVGFPKLRRTRRRIAGASTSSSVTSVPPPTCPLARHAARSTSYAFREPRGWRLRKCGQAKAWGGTHG